MECFLNYYIHNDIIKPCEKFSEGLLTNGISVYEVIRIEKGVPIFIEDHLERLFNSAHILNLKITVVANQIITTIKQLIDLNKTDLGKIKILVQFDPKTKKQQNILYYFNPHYFPTITEYSNGVSTGLCLSVRESPNAKVHNTDTRKKANNIIAEQKLFEVILADNDGHLTEGSRSNLLFISGNTVISAPEKDILQGIARKNVKRICNLNNIPFIEKQVHISSLSKMEAMFLTGTSLKILPVANFENYSFTTNNNLLNRLMELYDQSIVEYIKKDRLT